MTVNLRVVTRTDNPTGNSTPTAAPLQSAGGGGNSNDMEARVAKLEAHVEHLVADVANIRVSVSDITKTGSDIRVDVATIKAQLAEKPSKGFIVSVVLTACAVLGALSVFHEKIVALLKP